MPATDQGIEHRIRLALSWREKARKLATSARVDRLRDFYRTQEQAAQAALEAARATGMERIESHAAELRRLLEPGNTDPAKAEKTEAVRLRIARLNLFLSANSPEVAGGYLDLPLDAYARELDAPVAPTRTALLPMPPLWQWLAVALIGLAAWTGARWYFTPDHGVSFEARLMPGATSQVAVQLVNHRPLTLELDLAAVDTGAPQPVWRIAVSVQPINTDDFLLLSDCLDAWQYGRQTVQPDAPIEVPPGMQAELILHAEAIRKRVASQLRAIRLELLTPEGRVAARAEIPLLEAAAAPPSRG
jgi:hypothetical protein